MSERTQGVEGLIEWLEKQKHAPSQLRKAAAEIRDLRTELEEVKRGRDEAVAARALWHDNATRATDRLERKDAALRIGSKALAAMIGAAEDPSAFWGSCDKPSSQIAEASAGLEHMRRALSQQPEEVDGGC